MVDFPFNFTTTPTMELKPRCPSPPLRDVGPASRGIWGRGGAIEGGPRKWEAPGA